MLEGGTFLCVPLWAIAAAVRFSAISWKGFRRQYQGDQTTPKWLIQANGILGFHRLAIMGLAPSGMSDLSSWETAMWSATEKFTDLRKIKEALSDRYSVCKRFRLRDPPAVVSGIWHGYVCYAGCRVRLYSSTTAIQGNLLRQEIPIGIRPSLLRI